MTQILNCLSYQFKYNRSKFPDGYVLFRIYYDLTIVKSRESNSEGNQHAELHDLCHDRLFCLLLLQGA